MKREGNLYQQIISLENLHQADKNAQKGKGKQYGVIEHNKNSKANIIELHYMLKDKTYRPSGYRTFWVHEPKPREIQSSPYFPDRIVQHAVMIITEPFWRKIFTTDTYSCIKGKGIHSASFALRESLKDKESTKYCLKLDIKKYYPSVDNDILKSLIRRKIKDQDLLWLLDMIIDSAKGLPIGNYLSQPFGNLYLAYFDHWVKEKLKVERYFRYCDDIVILADSKPYLHNVLAKIREYLQTELKLTIKDNYQVFLVDSRGIDFVGFPTFHDYVLIRKSIKKNFIRKLAKNPNQQTIASYMGWLKHCDSKNLQKHLFMKRFSELGIKIPNYFSGKKASIKMLIDCEIEVLKYRIRPSRADKARKCLHLDINHNGKNYIVFTNSEHLIDIIKLVKVDDFPFQAVISIDEYNRYQFH